MDASAQLDDQAAPAPVDAPPPPLDAPLPPAAASAQAPEEVADGDVSEDEYGDESYEESRPDAAHDDSGVALAELELGDNEDDVAVALDAASPLEHAPPPQQPEV